MNLKTLNYLMLIRFLLVTGILLITTGCKQEKNFKNPNVVFILADDLGWADLPMYGNEFNESPNLEKLASEGMLFTNAYAAGPVCSPTRASIMSGQYPARVGIIDFITGHWRPYEEVTVPTNRTQYLPSEIITLGEVMKEAGYATGYFGKWHLGTQPEHHPSEQGFDEAYEYAGGGYYSPSFRPAFEMDDQKRLSEQLTDFSIDFIEENKENPFFLFLAHYDVHVQLDADSSLIEKYLNKEKVPGYTCNAVYAGMIEHLDNSVGRILSKLEELELEENTMVIFFSDNGGLVSRFDKIPLIAGRSRNYYEGDTLLYIATTNDPLRNEKGTVFEGGIREPLIIRWPGKITAGSRSDAIVTSVDFFPTLLELTGANPPESQVLDGQSIVPVFFDEEFDPDRAIYWHYPVYHHMEPASAVRKGDWKLIHFLVDDHVELYNLKEDINESNDISAGYPEKTKELMDLLDSWREENDARFPEKNPDFDPERRYEWGIHPDRRKNN